MPELTEKEREELEKSLLELNRGRVLMEAMREQMALLSTTLSELSSTIETIKKLKELPEGTEILTPIGSGSFVRAKLMPLEKILTGVGAEVVIERTPEEALKFLEEKSAEVGRAVQRLQSEMANLQQKMEDLRPQIEKLLSKVKEK
ncbi:MAG: prefoldin subunit alpha [Hadesarchaea archaeon]|nr:MAG: prefoldin subunit alpha [Hadesarchaea archaeon]TDA34268.1 MAG: prefoldin subunit alpha [Hadesarchaea archaeon]